MSKTETWQVKPGVYAIERTLTVDHQTIVTRYEAPSADEVVKLAVRCGEVFESAPDEVIVEDFARRDLDR